MVPGFCRVHSLPPGLLMCTSSPGPTTAGGRVREEQNLNTTSEEEGNSGLVAVGVRQSVHKVELELTYEGKMASSQQPKYQASLVCMRAGGTVGLD